MTNLTLSILGDEALPEQCGELRAASFDGEATARITNEAAEGGHSQEKGPLTWLNSACLVTNTEDDSISCVVSVGDPRAGFAFTVRRMPDGRIVLHVPHAGESTPHMHLRPLHEGTFEIVDRPADQEGAKASDFSDPKLLEFVSSMRARWEPLDALDATDEYENRFWIVDGGIGGTWHYGCKRGQGSEEERWVGAPVGSRQEAIDACEEAATDARLDSTHDFEDSGWDREEDVDQ